MRIYDVGKGVVANSFLACEKEIVFFLLCHKFFVIKINFKFLMAQCPQSKKNTTEECITKSIYQTK